MSSNLMEIAEDSARGSFFLVTGNIFAITIQFVTVFVVARLLGPESYGIYALSLAVPSLLLSFVGFGVGPGLIYFSANLRVRQQEKQVAKLLRDSLLFKLFFGLIAFGVCFILSDYFATYILNRPSIGFYIRLASITIILSVIFNTANLGFVGLDRMEYSAVITVIGAFVKMVVAFLLVILGLSVTGAIAGFVMGLFVSGLFGVCILYFKLYRQMSSSDSTNSHSFKDSVRTLLHYGFPLYISTLLLGFIPQFRNIILALFADDVDVGNFNAMLNFGVLLNVVSASIATSLFPAFSKLEINSEKAKEFFAIAVKYMSLVMIPATLIIILCSRELVQVIYGDSYVSASSFLSFYCVLYLLVGLGYQTQTRFFNGLAETRITFKRGLIIFLLFVCLAPVLAFFFSTTGLILALLISNMVGAIYGAHVIKSKFKCEFNYKNLIRVYLAAFISVAPAFFVLQFSPFSALFNVLTTGTIYLLLYVTLLPLLKVVTYSELKNVEYVVGRVPFLKLLLKGLMKYEHMLIRKFA